MAFKLLESVATNVSGAGRVISGASHPEIQVYSTGTSSCNVDIQLRSASDAPWYTAFTVANPTGGTEGSTMVALPPAYEVRCKVRDWASGTISANMNLFSEAAFREIH